MAEGRMLKKTIANSKKLAQVSDRARVVWFMMLPHADIEGRVKACPPIVKGQYLTMLNYTEAAIQKALVELHTAGLLVLYKAGNDQCAEFTRFRDFQNLYQTREADSKIPPPTQENSCELLRTQAKEKGREEKLREGNEKHTHEEFVLLTDTEYQSLKDNYGQKVSDDYIRRLNDYIGSKGKKYKSHYHTVLNWLRKDNIKPKSEKAEKVKAARDKLRAEFKPLMSEWSEKDFAGYQAAYGHGLDWLWAEIRNTQRGKQ